MRSHLRLRSQKMNVHKRKLPIKVLIKTDREVKLEKTLNHTLVLGNDSYTVIRHRDSMVYCLSREGVEYVRKLLPTIKDIPNKEAVFNKTLDYHLHNIINHEKMIRYIANYSVN